MHTTERNDFLNDNDFWWWMNEENKWEKNVVFVVVFHWKNDHKWLFSAIISLLFFHLKNGSILSRVWRDTCVCDWKFKNSLCIAAVVPRFIYKSMISVSNLYIKQSNQNSTYKKKKKSSIISSTYKSTIYKSRNKMFKVCVSKLIDFSVFWIFSK